MKVLILIILWPLAIFAQFESYLSKDFKDFKFDQSIKKTSKLSNTDQIKMENEDVEKILSFINIKKQNSRQKMIGTKVFHKNQDQGIYELINIDDGHLNSITKCHSKSKEKIIENDNNVFLANFINSLERKFLDNFTYSCMTINKSICEMLKESTYHPLELQTLVNNSESLTQYNTSYMNILGIAKPDHNFIYPMVNSLRKSDFLKKLDASKNNEQNVISQYKISEMKRICKRTKYNSFKPSDSKSIKIETSYIND